MAKTRKANAELSQRNCTIYEYYRSHPDVSYSEIAKTYSISSQRVQFLVQRQIRNEVIKDKNILVNEMRKRSANE
ncbi:MAG: hypothetical protein P3T54_05740 [Dehalogenimonas sp.]|uniref:RNA polymerase sigma-70 region 4 domain-containing protein n=1 Tax=Candidatus Dehalogenimonas loeffleri TaxID=3127115 RepID=A0ABZ2J4N2_9CHLR|nr:hypothetical protein [Dehalogenimonas sp.]